jgi:phosphotransferase system IIB component
MDNQHINVLLEELNVSCAISEEKSEVLVIFGTSRENVKKEKNVCSPIKLKKALNNV